MVRREQAERELFEVAFSKCVSGESSPVVAAGNHTTWAVDSDFLAQLTVDEREAIQKIYIGRTAQKSQLESALHEKEASLRQETERAQVAAEIERKAAADAAAANAKRSELHRQREQIEQAEAAYEAKLTQQDAQRLQREEDAARERAAAEEQAALEEERAENQRKLELLRRKQEAAQSEQARAEQVRGCFSSIASIALPYSLPHGPTLCNACAAHSHTSRLYCQVLHA